MTNTTRPTRQPTLPIFSAFDTPFDRFEICEAAFAFASECHKGQDSDTYAILSRLDRIGFSPGMSGGYFEGLEDTGKMRYLALWCKYYPTDPLPANVSDWARETLVENFLETLILSDPEPKDFLRTLILCDSE